MRTGTASVSGFGWQVWRRVSSEKNRGEAKEDNVARVGSAYLNTNDMFPQLELQLVCGEKLKLPEERRRIHCRFNLSRSLVTFL